MPQLESPRRTSRLMLLAGVLGVLLLLACFHSAAADEDEAPSDVNAFPNSPGMITVTWSHSGEGVYGFVLEQESPAAYTTPDRDKRAWSVPNLEAGRTYRYRVCAVFAYHRACSDWVAVTTLLPPPSGSESGSGTASNPELPAAVAHPVLQATVVNARAVDLAWDLPPSGSVVLTHGTLYRDGTAIYEALQEGNYDADYRDVNRQMNSTYRYRFCFRGPAFGERCSAEVAVTTPLVVEEPFVPGGTSTVSAYAPELGVHISGFNPVNGATPVRFVVSVANTGRSGSDAVTFVVRFDGTHLVAYDVMSAAPGFYCDREGEGFRCTGSLSAKTQPGSEAYFIVRGWGIALGESTVTATVDPDQSVAEMSEANNTAQFTTTVVEPGSVPDRPCTNSGALGRRCPTS